MESNGRKGIDKKKKEENNITQKMKPIELMWYKLSIDKTSVGRIEDLYSESGRYCLEKLQKDTKSWPKLVR